MKSYYLDSNKLLEKLVKNIYDKKIIAIDTEFTREKTYYPILSLIQIGVGGEHYAIDCLSDIDLQPILDIISDEKVCKILHSCQQDLQIFHQKAGKKAKNIIDLQLMANFCGVGYNIGYSGLVKEFRGIEIDKKMQRSNWQRRPLSEEQIKYALLDVVYLEGIYFEMFENLKKEKREDWFFEDMANLTEAVDFVNENGLLKSFIKNKRSYIGDVDKIAKAKDLILWREKLAQKKDVPRQHLVRDEVLEAFIDGRKAKLKVGQKELLEAQDIIESAKKDDFAVDFDIGNSIMSAAQKKEYQKARSLIEEIARDLGLKEQFLINVACLKDVILRKNKVENLVFGWRYSLFGKKLENLIS